MLRNKKYNRRQCEERARPLTNRPLRGTKQSLRKQITDRD